MFNRTNFSTGYYIVYIPFLWILYTGYKYQVVGIFSNSVMNISVNVGPSDDTIATSLFLCV